jgi:hypothetical protein
MLGWVGIAWIRLALVDVKEVAHKQSVHRGPLRGCGGSPRGLNFHAWCNNLSNSCFLSTIHKAENLQCLGEHLLLFFNIDNLDKVLSTSILLHKRKNHCKPIFFKKFGGFRWIESNEGLNILENIFYSYLMLRTFMRFYLP